MFFLIIFFLIILTLGFTYINHNPEFSATASAIQQIWSGTCRLSCRPDNNIRFDKRNDFIGKDNIIEPEGWKQEVAVNNVTTEVCVCETCPCSLIETVLKTCSPATTIYTECLETISNAYYDIVKTLAELYVYMEQVMVSRESRQRRSQPIPISETSTSKAAELCLKIKEEVKSAVKTSFSRKPSILITFRKSDVSLVNKAGTSRAQSTNTEEMSISTQSSKNCSKCDEKGVICIDKCPREKRTDN